MMYMRYGYYCSETCLIQIWCKLHTGVVWVFMRCMIMVIMIGIMVIMSMIMRVKRRHLHARVTTRVILRKAGCHT